MSVNSISPLYEEFRFHAEIAKSQNVWMREIALDFERLVAACTVALEAAQTQQPPHPRGVSEARTAVGGSSLSGLILKGIVHEDRVFAPRACG